jgi:hypothetical protein
MRGLEERQAVHYHLTSSWQCIPVSGILWILELRVNTRLNCRDSVYNTPGLVAAVKLELSAGMGSGLCRKMLLGA